MKKAVLKHKDSKEEKQALSELNENQKRFCREYIFDWNASRAYKIAYPNVNDATARANASELLTKPNIQQYVELIQKDLEKLAGISRMKVISEHMKMAFSSIAHLHNTWIERKDFDELTEDQKACIAEISTQTRTQRINDEPVDVEFVKIKLYDKQKALDSISKMLGYDAPSKIEFPEGISITFVRK